MKSLYESILDDIDVSLEKGDKIAMEIAYNKPDSKLRKIFGIGNKIETPFVVTIDKNKNKLECNNGQIVAYLDAGAYNLKEEVPDLDVLQINGKLSMNCTGPIKLIPRNFCNTFTAHALRAGGIHTIDGIDFIIQHMDGVGYFNHLEFDGDLTKIANCRIENFGNNELKLHSLPEFSKVSSNTIQKINISLDDKLTPAKFWDNKLLSKLFDSNYTVDYTVGDDGTIITTNKIKSFNDIKKMVTSKDRSSIKYKTNPIRIKPGVKLSDVIDISKFNELSRIYIYDSKIAIVFAKVGSDEEKHSIKVFSTATLNCDLPDDEKFEVTADGWRVMVTAY